MKLVSRRGIWLVLRILIWPALVIIALNIENWVNKLGYSSILADNAGSIMGDILGIVRSAWVQVPALLIVGGAVTLWIDRLLRGGEVALVEAQAKLVHESRMADKLNRFHPAVITQTDPKPLTQDQRQFRMQLLNFAITYPAQLQGRLGTVLEILRTIEKVENKDSANSILLQFLLSLAAEFNLDGLRPLMHLKEEVGEAGSERIDVNETQKHLMTFLNAYHNRQKILGNLNGITKANLAKLPEMKEWLEVDADARKEFGKMRIFTEATIVTENHDDKWASTGKAWQTQHRVY